MAADSVDDDIEIREFVTPLEVTTFPGFLDANPIDLANYGKLLGHYNFADAEMSCCYRKPNGNLCEHAHKRGLVIRLIDRSVTILGNHCAADREKFGAHATLHGDWKRYKTKQRRLETQDSLDRLREDRVPRLTQLSELTRQVTAQQRRAHEILESFGRRVPERIMEMNRNRRYGVTVQFIEIRTYVDEKGRQQEQRIATPRTIGALAGLGIFDDARYDAIHDSARKVRTAYAQSDLLGKRPSQSKLSELVRNIGEFPRVVAAARELFAEQAEFLGSDLWPLCFLVRDRGARYDTVQACHALQGEPIGRRAAEIRLRDKERELCTPHGAHDIEIG